MAKRKCKCALESRGVDTSDVRRISHGLVGRNLTLQQGKKPYGRYPAIILSSLLKPSIIYYSNQMMGDFFHHSWALLRSWSEKL